MFSLPPGRITDWFKELLGVEEIIPEEVDKWVSQRSTDEVVKLLAKTGVPVGPVLDLDEEQKNEQAIARKMFVKVNYPTLGEIVEPGFPLKFSESKGDPTHPAPILGKHINEILSNILGLSSEKLNELRTEGVI